MTRFGQYLITALSIGVFGLSVLTGQAQPPVPSFSFPSNLDPEYDVVISRIADHDTTCISELAGMKTYRMYVSVADSADIVTAGYGNNTAVLDIRCEASNFYQSPFGGSTPNSITPLLWETLPTLDSSLSPASQFDSWVTIGIDRSPPFMGAGYEAISVAGNWETEFESGGAIEASDLVGGGWIAFPNTLNVIPDSNNLVLIGQFTCATTLSGSLGVQIIPSWASSGDDLRLPFQFSSDSIPPDPDAPFDCTCLPTDSAGCTYPLACNFSVNAIIDDGSCIFPIPGTDCTGECLVDDDSDGLCDHLDDCVGSYDALGTCNGDCIADLDADGICDSEDDCIGVLDSCGVCNGSGAILECGCEPIEVGFCDCNGQQSDAIGECGGTCEADIDNDGICDSNEIAGCMDSLACNFNPFATLATSTCLIPGPCEGCLGDSVVTINDDDFDGICNEDEILGCTNAEANNFDPLATEDNGTCKVFGCTDTLAINYNPFATDHDQSCEFLCIGSAGCTYSEAENYVDSATCDDGSCTFSLTTAESACPLDFDGNGIIGSNDLLTFLSWYEQPCEEE